MESELKKYSVKNVKDAYAALEATYKTVLKNELAVIDTLKEARENGVVGDDLKSFKNDKTFKAAFKIYDNSVTAIDQGCKLCIQMTTQAGFLKNDLANLKQEIEKDFKNTRDKDVLALIDSVVSQMKQMAFASDIYDATRDKKMHEYATKFDKHVQRLLEHAPKSDKPALSALPDDFEPESRSKEYKIIKTILTRIDKQAKKVKDILAKPEALNAKLILYAGKEIKLIEEFVEIIDKKVKHVEKLIATAQAPVKKEGDADNKTKLADMIKFNQMLGKDLKTAKQALADAEKLVADAKEKLKDSLAT
jgi:hypothetical protein